MFSSFRRAVSEAVDTVEETADAARRGDVVRTHRGLRSLCYQGAGFDFAGADGARAGRELADCESKVEDAVFRAFTKG